jgi:arylsulfatase
MKKNIRTLLLASSFLALPYLTAHGQEKVDADRPNIVVFMADDMGYSDIGCYGGEIATPHIDSLAQKGIRFLRFTNNAKCTPTRTSLYTGNYEGWEGDPAQGTNLVKALNEAGYRTYMTGKTHGFDYKGTRRSAVLDTGCASFFDLSFTELDGTITRFPLVVDGEDRFDVIDEHPDFYATDVFTDYALEFLEDDRVEDSPFFLFLAYTAPHAPMHAREEDIAKYRGRYMMGWERLRELRFLRMGLLGILEEGMKLGPRERSPSWNLLSNEEQEAWDLRMAVYAAMIDRMDWNIGRVLKKIEDLGEKDNTLVVFLSDNGAATSWRPEYGEEPVKGTWISQGTPWANASNTPLRGFKPHHYEGGLRTPLIMYWPKVIQEASFDREFGHVVDLTATFLDVAGVPNPELLGKTLTPVFHGEERELHEEFNWGWSQRRTARRGKWKAVKVAHYTWELFNMEEDPGELNNLAGKYPEIVKSLVEQWEEWDAQVTYENEVKGKAAVKREEWWKWEEE